MIENHKVQRQYEAFEGNTVFFKEEYKKFEYPVVLQYYYLCGKRIDTEIDDPLKVFKDSKLTMNDLPLYIDTELDNFKEKVSGAIGTILDFAELGNILSYAMTLKIDNKEELIGYLTRICNFIIISDYFTDDTTGKNHKKAMRKYYLLYSHLTNLCQTGRLTEEIERVAERIFFINAHKNIENKLENIFKLKEHSEFFKDKDITSKKDSLNKICERIKNIYTINDTDIDFLKYFVVQCLSFENFNPSLTKSLYISSDTKNSGKTTFGKTLTCLLNGVENVSDFCKFSSTLPREAQFGTHDIPSACLHNCTLLDEAMPHDTKKSYGTIKTMLTSNGVTYNPKFQSEIYLKARRNYVFTSNDSIMDYIQDYEDRRFYEINFNYKPTEFLTETDLIKLLKNFIYLTYIVHYQDNMQEWYLKFENVKGKAFELNEDLFETIVSECSDYNTLDKYFSGRYTSPMTFARAYWGQNVSDEKITIAKKMFATKFNDFKLTGKGNSSKFYTSKIRAYVLDCLNDTDFGTIEPNKDVKETISELDNKINIELMDKNKQLETEIQQLKELQEDLIGKLETTLKELNELKKENETLKVAPKNDNVKIIRKENKIDEYLNSNLDTDDLFIIEDYENFSKKDLVDALKVCYKENEMNKQELAIERERNKGVQRNEMLNKQVDLEDTDKIKGGLSNQVKDSDFYEIKDIPF